MSSLDNFLQQKIQRRKDENSFRALKQINSLVDFTSNDYLGLAQSKLLYDQILERIDTLSLKSNGAAGPRLLSGNTAYTENVEKKLATIFRGEASLIFNSGFFANVSVLSSIPQKGDTILYDERAHASIKDGARLSLANRFSFKHNDLDDLERKIKVSAGKKFIVIESIYSMDGDSSPLAAITKLAERYDAFIVLDEAHSTGVLGANGSGLATSLALENKVDIRIYTFGKAMGCHGACVVGSKNLIDYLVNFARPFIYTTALPIHNIVTIDCAFEFLSRNIGLQQQLSNNVALFTSKLKSTSTSAIQAIIIPGNNNVRNVADELQRKGFDVRAILSPTVATGLERLRICLHAYNTHDDIVELSEIINELKQKYLTK